MLIATTNNRRTSYAGPVEEGSSTKSQLFKERIVLAVAAPAELRAVLEGLGAPSIEIPLEWESVQITEAFEVLRTGVGKANACGAAARLLDPQVHHLILCIGIAGSLPGPSPAALGAVVAADAIVMADEGVQGPQGFQSLASLGFPPLPGGDTLVPPEWVLRWLIRFGPRVGPIATVSTCSGTDAAARALAQRTGAVAEAMEGAGVALAAVHAGVAFGELRIISNSAGDRDRQEWRLKEALHRLSEVVADMKSASAALSDLAR